MPRNQNGVSKPRCAENRDWLLKIGRNYMNLNYLRNDDMWNRKASEFCNQMEIDETYNFYTIDPTEKSLYAIIEEDPLRSFNYIQRESVKSYILFSRMSLFLSGTAIEVICTKIFSKKDVNDDFVLLFYERFFSFFLTRTYTWYSLHLLIRASKAYPTYFRSTMRSLLRDIYIKSTVLQDYVSRLNEEDCTSLMKLAVETEFTAEKFDHAAPVMYIMYKKCKKTDSIFRFMLSKLELCSHTSAHNQSFGRLTLYFVQNISGRDIIFQDLKNMVERHRTAYKNLCLTALDKYINQVIALQANLAEEGPRIFIPRPLEVFQL